MSNPEPFLNAIAKQNHKLYFGTATNLAEFTNDTAYRDIISDSRVFGQITPAHGMKWDEIEPGPGNFTFEVADAIVAFAKRNGQIMRGHNCVWNERIPDWVENGNWTEKELLAVVENHCGTIVGRYRVMICSNVYAAEVINDDGTGTFREDIFFNVTGTKYIAAAFRAARAADPHAKLYANDFNIEGFNVKSDAYRKLIPELKRQGVPIDGLGIQSHMTVGQVPPNVKENIESFVALGVEVALTELDVKMPLPATQEMLEQQRKDYETMIEACNAVRGCIGITVWDFTDKYSWIPGTFPGLGAACPWDDNLQLKPAISGIIDGFGRRS
ncbi:endo-1,4-beta xylanase [Panus rudis PR-1116 ss-1]|nr:endo-1,4-beta xylanase [Panus rudis PR-1116 ss-1]